MSNTTTSSELPSRGRGHIPGRSRGNRGGYGKYLRARGRGRGYGRPAEFNKRLVLEGEEKEDMDEEEAAERTAKYSRRQLGTNADRYAEPEPELGSDGEPQVEPEVDLSGFLEKQKISDDSPWTTSSGQADEGEVDTSLAHIGSQRHVLGSSKKGKIEQIEWDNELDELSQEKASAEAKRELKARFRAKAARLSAKPAVAVGRDRKADYYTEAPPLPLPDGSLPQTGDSKDELQDFLDELLG